MLRQGWVRRIGRPDGVNGGTIASNSAAEVWAWFSWTSSSASSSKETDSRLANRCPGPTTSRLSAGPPTLTGQPSRSQPLMFRALSRAWASADAAGASIRGPLVQ